MKHAALIMVLLLSVQGQSQTAKDLALDSLYPYKKAALRSAILPGLGQIYNSAHSQGRKNAYWKVPLIYAGLAATSFVLIQNQKTVNSVRQEYELRMGGNAPSAPWTDYDNAALISTYDQYARWRDLSILGLGAMWLFQIADAAVEAHFLNFNVSKDLSVIFRPKPAPNGMLCSVHFKFK
ncbi:MAG: hypothetical protein EBV19_03295 [Flavobacteriia bacterium]|nr:hypothetical protein [Flavobacteriia bacterium]